MMKITIIIGIIILCFPILAYTQATGDNIGDTIVNYTDIQGNKQGKWIKHYDNGQVRYKGFFIDDIPQGTFTYYHPNGKIKSVLNNSDDGSANVEMFWESGHPAAKGSYNPDRQRHSRWELYYTEGSLVSVINYKNGNPEGQVIMYYPGTKRKLLDCNYKNSKLHGKYKKYFDNGGLMEDGNYENGRKHGFYIYYTGEGFVHEQGEYVNGRREGEWTRFHLGEEQDKVNYIDGKPDNYDELIEEWTDREEWAKKNQHKFKDPHDYFDNPYEFFRESPDPYEQDRKK
jgi:antitoxin component YwqK of YwqJK toxin-antitoxin module